MNCSHCISGTYQTGLASTNCTLCGPGSYQTGVALINPSGCSLCNAGTYQTGSGISSSKQCLFCDSGTFQTGSGKTSSASCVLCSAGTYQTGSGLSQSSSCVLCDAGTYQSGSGMSTSLGLCSSSDNSRAIGLGVGLGIGLPIVFGMVFLAHKFMLKKEQVKEKVVPQLQPVVVQRTPPVVQPLAAIVSSPPVDAPTLPSVAGHLTYVAALPTMEPSIPQPFSYYNDLGDMYSFMPVFDPWINPYSEFQVVSPPFPSYPAHTIWMWGPGASAAWILMRKHGRVNRGDCRVFQTIFSRSPFCSILGSKNDWKSFWFDSWKSLPLRLRNSLSL